MLNTDLLLSYGATQVEFPVGHAIFNAGDKPAYYYQILEGRVKLNHETEDGKEFIQNILSSGQSVCELLLFIDQTYPVNAVVLNTCKVLRLPKARFFDILKDNHDLSMMINKFLSERLYHKFLMLQNNASLDPVVRLRGVLNYLKSFTQEETQYVYQIPLTRKQLAAITGLRVETVIRAIKKMETRDMLKIEDHKIFV